MRKLNKEKTMNSMKMETFRNNEFGSIRVIDDHGTLLFCGADVAFALGYKNTRKALIDHCRCVTKRYAPHPQSNNKQIEMSFIPEGDVYRLIVHSRLPNAERFEKWVFEEVLPSIRKTGGYMTDSLLNQAANDPNVLLRFASQLLEEHEKNTRLKAEMSLMKPKADYFDAFIHTDDCTNIRATAKELEIGEREFCRFLTKAGFMYRCPAGNLLPYAKPSNEGLFRVKDFISSTGHFGQQTVITPRGKELFRQLLCEGRLRKDSQKM